MRSHGLLLSLIRYIFTFALILLATGCGDSSTSNETSSDALVSVHADAGNIVAVRVNNTAILDGSGSSTTSTAQLEFAWSFLSKPDASKAVLQNETSVSPGFIGDVAGTYRVQLVTRAGGVSSQRAVALVEVSVDGTLTGIRIHTSYPSQCSECHDGRFAVPVGPLETVPPKSGIHPATSNLCQACHTTFGFDIQSFVDHSQVLENCSSCHNGVIAIGKSEFHTSTTAECSDCHNTVSFLELDVNGQYDHTGISSGCVGCHNGTIAIGSPTTQAHLDNPTTDCSSCHNISSFADAYPDHSNFKTDGTRCDSCHGSSAQGPKLGHPVMSVDCGTCHSIKQFSLGGVFNHRVDAAVQPCMDCHTDGNSINARSKSALPTHITTTADCGVCHGVGGGDFALGITDHSDPTVMAQACDSCHDGVTAIGKPDPNHMPTLLDCGACHTSGNFATGVFDHDPTIVDPLTCSSCHDDVITAGKNLNHLPTTSDCRACHTTDTFVGAVFDHGSTTTDCASCHDGKISTGKSVNHMPTAQDCSVCHAASIPVFNDFKGGIFNHLVGVSSNCASCHDGVIAIDKSTKVNHIPAKTECSECHSDTTVPGGFMTAALFPDVHINFLNGCEGCHTTKYFPALPLVKAAGHVPTSQDCHSCHSNVDFADKTKFIHADISGNCESCHDGNYIDPAGALGKVSDPTPPHPVTTADCGLCHGIGNNFTDGIFDHTGIVDNCSSCHGDAAPAPPVGAVTRKSSAHVTTTQDCNICHVPGSFATAVFNHDQIITDCASCHGGPTPTATVKPSPTSTPPGFHVDTLEDCSVCHNKTAFAGAKYDHTDILDNCASCHDGSIAPGKNGTHVPTSGDCATCHSKAGPGFIPATFDHAGIVDNCETCHDGIFATGKNIGHVVTTADCGACHRIPPTEIIANGATNGFIPATHSPVADTTRCDSCHGVNATGKDAKTNPDHLTTSLDCRSCHTTASFIPGGWVHDASTVGRCDTCHITDGGAQRVKPTTGHITTTSQCDECHTTDAWAPTNFSHDPGNINQDDYPGDHNGSPACSACHGNSIDNPFVYPPNGVQYAPFCAACHENDFDRKGDHIGGENGTVEQNKDCSGGGRGCHKVSDRNFD